MLGPVFPKLFASLQGGGEVRRSFQNGWGPESNL